MLEVKASAVFKLYTQLMCLKLINAFHIISLPLYIRTCIRASLKDYYFFPYSSKCTGGKAISTGKTHLNKRELCVNLIEKFYGYQESEIIWENDAWDITTFIISDLDDKQNCDWSKELDWVQSLKTIYKERLWKQD